MSASPVSATFTKTIRYDKESRDYRAELDGELIGWFKTYHAAEVELDRVAHDWLTHGYDRTVSELDGGADDDAPPEPTEVNWNSFASDPPSDPLPTDGPGDPIPGDIGYPDERSTFHNCYACKTAEYPASAMYPPVCIECFNAMLHGLPNRFRAAEEAAKLAHSRQSIAVEARITTCPNCEGIHHVQTCPEIGDAPFAPEPRAGWKDVALGRELCKMRRRHAKFVALLQSAPPAHLVMYADSYVAFIHDCNHASDLTRRDVLKVWMRLIGADRLAA